MLEALEKHVADEQAWNRFLELGLPTKEWEVFRYVRLNALYSRIFEKAEEATPPVEQKKGQLVFVNGRYCEKLSQPADGTIALPLEKARKTYGSFLNHRLPTQLKEENDPFAALNNALSDHALFIYLPPKSVSRIEIVHLTTAQAKPVVMAPRLHLFAGKEAESKLFISHQTDHWVNSYVDVALDERASITLTGFLDGDEASWHFDAVRATLKRESRFSSYAVAHGVSTSRQDYVVRLLEDGAEASLYGVCQLKDRSHHHVNVLMEHCAPHCRSLQHFKNVLKDISRTSFEGKIYVHQAAQKTEAYQMNHNLILSKRASANSKPNLEIFADDVKASHGSTVGQLDEEQLFYLKTRGIPQEIAKQLLVQGFCQEILDLIEGSYAKNLCRFS